MLIVYYFGLKWLYCSGINYVSLQTRRKAMHGKGDQN
jgi:hypothetical protein